MDLLHLDSSIRLPWLRIWEW